MYSVTLIDIFYADSLYCGDCKLVGVFINVTTRV